jgi:hypothetical protein
VPKKRTARKVQVMMMMMMMMMQTMARRRTVTGTRKTLNHLRHPHRVFETRSTRKKDNDLVSVVSV